MDASPLQDPSSRKAILPLVLKAIRRHRGLRSSEVARAMGMRLRTYQHFESGRAGLNLERIHQFAEAVNADGYAIVMALDIGSVEFALHCLENKASTVFLVSLQRFANKAGKDIARLDPRSFISAFDRASGWWVATAPVSSSTSFAMPSAHSQLDHRRPSRYQSVGARCSATSSQG